MRLATFVQVVTEPATSAITLTAAIAAIGSAMAELLGLDPTMIIWGFLGALLLVSRDTTDHEHRIRRAILVLIGGAIIAGGIGGYALALAVEHFDSKPAPPLKIAIGVALGVISQALVSGATGLVGAVFVALGDRIKKIIGGSNG